MPDVTPQPAGRFAPSPSGPMHLGNARTALLAWLDARSRGQRVVLRIEDLDRGRCRPEYSDLARQDLQWLGLDWDAETPPQSARTAAYEAAVGRLRADGLVYECYCSRGELAAASAPHGGERRYPGTCRSLTPRQRAARAAGRRPALRVRLPDRDLTVTDRLHGALTENPQAAAGDIIVRRSDGVHAYQLAVVVDDAADGVTDVVRGDDLLASAARQAALQDLLGLPRVVYAHVPLMLGPDGARLAKRHGAVAIQELRESARTPAQVVGELAGSLGLAPPDASPTPAELARGFDLQTLSSL